VNLASITESRDAGMVMNADSVIYARLNRSENGRADSITIKERSSEKSWRKDRQEKELDFICESVPQER